MDLSIYYYIKTKYLTTSDANRGFSSSFAKKVPIDYPMGF